MKNTYMVSLAVLGLFYGNSAYAECEKSYSVNEVMTDIKKAKEALRDADDSVLVTVGKDIEGKLLCLDAKLLGNGQVFEKLYRFVGYGYFYSDNVGETKKWFSSAQEALPSFRFATDALEDEELILLYDDVRTNRKEKTILEDKSLQVPAGTKLYINGNLTSSAEYTQGQYNYAYLLSEIGDNLQVQARFSFDETFPEPLLKEGGEVIYDASVKKVDRLRPPEKTPLMILGGVTTLAAIGLYGYTYKTNQDFDAATNPDDLRNIQSLNNNLIITSGIVGFVGFGLGYTGVLIDERGRIRF